jgi:hypothetical protein
MDRRSGLEVYVLVQQSQLNAACAHDVATIRCLITSDKAKDRTFSSAVSAYKSYVFSRVYLERRASQHILNAVGLMNF